MGSVVVAVTVGFLLGILLMIFLVAGRKEEDLLDRVEQLESSRTAPPRDPGGMEETADTERPERIPPRRF